MKEATESKMIANEIEIKYSNDVYYAFLKYVYTDCVEAIAEFNGNINMKRKEIV